MSNGTKDDKNDPVPPPVEPIKPPGEPDPPLPSDQMGYFELGVYVRDRFLAKQGLDDQAMGIGRRTAVQMWFAGAALDIIHRKETREKGWKNWCEAHEFNVGTCYEAMRLFKRSGGVDNIRGMTITEARTQYQTNKGKWTPPGAEPQGNEPPAATANTTEPVAADATVEPTTEGTTPNAAEASGPHAVAEGTKPLGILGRLREDLDDLGEVADALAKSDANIEEADANIAIKRIDEVMVKLREAKKTLTKAAKAKLKANATTKVAAKVGDDR